MCTESTNNPLDELKVTTLRDGLYEKVLIKKLNPNVASELVELVMITAERSELKSRTLIETRNGLVYVYALRKLAHQSIV